MMCTHSLALSKSLSFFSSDPKIDLVSILSSWSGAKIFSVEYKTTVLTTAAKNTHFITLDCGRDSVQ